MGCLGDLDAGGECFFKLVDVSDDQNTIEVVLNGVDGRYQMLATTGILGAKAHINE